MFTETVAGTTYLKNSRGYILQTNSRGLITLRAAYLDDCSEMRFLRIEVAKQDAAEKKAAIAAAMKAREENPLSIFSRTPFGPQMSKNNYRVKPASRAWIEANRL